jgi:hypothetical protein
MQLAVVSVRSGYVLSSILVAMLAPTSRAQTAIRSIAGFTGERLGAAICDAGDTNGDGWRDYLVGAPSANGGRGGVICISGKYLATALGAQQLFSYYPSAQAVSADAAFGTSLANLGDVTGDNVADFAVGAPYADVSAFDNGEIFLIDGATHAPTVGTFSATQSDDRLGWSISPAGDVNGDGYMDLLAGMPKSTSMGLAWVLSGRKFVSTGAQSPMWTLLPPNSWAVQDWFGYAVLGTADVDGDGVRDFAISAPNADNGTLDRGVVRIYSGAAGHAVLCDYWGLAAQGFGLTLAGAADFDGDGKADIAASAHKSSTGTVAGRVSVLSPQHIINGVPPFEIFGWDGPTPTTSQGPGWGEGLAISPDLNGDGRAEILIGAPKYGSAPAGSHGNKGLVSIYSGLTGMRIGGYLGADSERVGTALLGSLDDLDGDGRRDWLVGGANCAAPTTDCGVFKAVSLFPTLPTAYCIGKVNSQGCTPAINSSGYASSTPPAQFLIGATNVLNNKNGLLFYGFAPLANPFQGGVLCVASPTVRTPVQSSGGSASGTDCSGAFTFDFNAYLQAGGHGQLVTGKEVFCQYWSRDPQSPSTTSLSNALAFLVNP